MSKAFPVTGGQQIAATLTALGKRLESQAVRSGLTAAGGIIRDEARVRAPKESGLMARGIKTGSPRKNQDGSYSVSVRVTGKHAFLGYFHEYGTAAHLIARTSGGEGRVAVRKAAGGLGTITARAMKIGDRYVSGIIRHPGHTAHPFLRPALDIKAQEAIAAFRNRIIAVVEGKTGYDMAAGMDEAA